MFAEIRLLFVFVLHSSNVQFSSSLLECSMILGTVARTLIFVTCVNFTNHYDIYGVAMHVNSYTCLSLPLRVWEIWLLHYGKSQIIVISIKFIMAKQILDWVRESMCYSV